jgi:uncharacterized oxidoreductase
VKQKQETGRAECRNLSPGRLEEIAISLFVSAGATPQDARIVARHLVEACLAGHDSHGILRIPQYVKGLQQGRIRSGVRPMVLAESATTAVIDGRLGFGQVIAGEGMALAVKKAKASGIGAVAIRNSNHSGRLGAYTAEAAREGVAALAMVNAGGGGQSVVPFGGLARRLATNPLSIAVPSAGSHPLLLDIATSVAPEGKIRSFYLEGKEVPSGWMIDAAGRALTDPQKFYQTPGAALLPLGGSAGYKGFGLAFMIDILAGALSGAGCCRFETPDPLDGIFLLAIDIGRFTPLEDFHRRVSELVEYVKSCPPAPGFEEVFVPGEVEARNEKERRLRGIAVPDPVWAEIEKLIEEHGLAERSVAPAVNPQA